MHRWRSCMQQWPNCGDWSSSCSW